MPNRSEHAFIGSLLGGAVAGHKAVDLSETARATEILGGLFGGWVGGMTPDLIEPATSPNHRDVAHGVITGLALSLAKISALQADCRKQAVFHTNCALSLSLGSLERTRAECCAMVWLFASGALAGFTAGYLSHLALDSLTAKGIPFLGTVVSSGA
jgi:hypothetical protein